MLPSGIVIFAVGETSKTISVTVVGNTAVEPDETFMVSLSAPSIGLVIGTATVIGTIRNDDATVSITASSANPLEGNSGTTTATFVLTLSGDTTVSHSVSYAVAGAGANRRLPPTSRAARCRLAA